MLSYTIIGSGDSAGISFVDLSTGESGNYGRFGTLDEDKKHAILSVLDCEQSTVKDVYTAIRESGSNDTSAIRKELGIIILADSVIIGGVAFPRRISALLEGATTLEEAKSVVAFAKKLSDNPGEHCKEAMIEWLLHNPSLTFTADGNIIGYRAVKNDFGSKHRGYGIVNGVEYDDASLDNSPGNVLEFPRAMVDADTSTYCSIGLHVGTWDYAWGFGSGDDRRVIVEFSPADVVSPPSDAAQEKIRVSKFTVIREVKTSLDDFIIDTATETN